MIETAKPKYLVPIHGEYRMLFRHKEFAKNHCGYEDENVILIENGNVLEIDEFGARVTAKNELYKMFIDEESHGELQFETVRDRKKLAYGGAISLVVTIDKETKKIIDKPQITFQGVAGIDFSNGMLDNARTFISNAINAMTKDEYKDQAFFKENLRIHLKRFIQKETGTKPVILPTIVEV